MDVKRYEPVHDDAMAADADGRFVTFADYEKLMRLYEAANIVCESVARWNSLPCDCDTPGAPCYRCDEWLTVERDMSDHDTLRKEAGL